jgi:hypothetical protein
MNSVGESVALIWGPGAAPIWRRSELGKLVQFERKGKARADRPARSTEAEILIFTGVRYERDSGAKPTKPTASSGAKRKRG